VQETSHVRRLV